MDLIKEAFQKIKQDIDLLNRELNFLREGVIETREKMIEMCEIIKNQNKQILPPKIPAYNSEIPAFPTDNPTLPQEIGGLKQQNLGISTGNRGVPTDKPTNQQTDIKEELTQKREEQSLEKVIEILNSLDNLKKELRLKFKRLTEQEVLVFSTIYQLEEELGHTDYKTISKRLNLSESSVRDYVQRLIKKGISVEKKRINNKIIHLSISPNLKKIASLSTILKLRDI